MDFEFGYQALLLVCFLSATLLPFPSEAFVAGMVLAGYDIITVWMIAAVGNWLGSMTNYFLGTWLAFNKLEKWFRLSHQRMERFSGWFQRYGIWVTALSWVPFIGDPLMLVAGIFRVSLLPTLIIVFLVKSIRYGILIWLTIQV